MKKITVFAVLMLVCILALVSCGVGTENSVTPPEAEYKIYSVTLKYNGKTVNGSLAVDLSMKEIQLSTDVRKDSGADGTVVYSSLNEKVATVDQNGKVTIHSKGEAVIRAMSGNKSHSIILMVKDDFNEKAGYTVTVNGGTANVTKAAPGEWVTLEAIIPAHKDFQSWNFSVAGIPLNGNSFKMPEGNVIVTAEYADKLYQLNVIGGATVTVNGEALSGTLSGNTKDGVESEYDIITYGVPFGADVKITAMNAPKGKIFVGWDAGVINNRVGEMGISNCSIEMPGENYTVWAHFSKITTKIMTGGCGYYDTSKGSKRITSGTPQEEAKDPDLEGLSGYRLSFTAGQSAISDYPENINGSVLDTVSEGTNTLKAIFKNHGNYDVTLEVYVSFYGNMVTSGHVKVPANSVVTTYFPAGLGLWEPWLGIALRENIEGSGETFNVDFVLGSAPMYPEGDPLLRTNGSADLVQLDVETDSVGKYGWERIFSYNEKYGLVTYSIWGAQFSNNVPAARSVQIVNMPDYDPDNPVTTVYARVINNATSGDFLSIFDVCVGTDKDPRNGKNTYYATVTHENIGDVVLIKIEIPRTPNDGPFYLSVRKTTVENTGTYYPHNFSMVLAYNDVFGYEEVA